MKSSEIRKAVLAKYPQAQYMNLSDSIGPCHCIDDDYNDRYLAYSCTSRRRAWYEALKNIQLGLLPLKAKSGSKGASA